MQGQDRSGSRRRLHHIYQSLKPSHWRMGFDLGVGYLGVLFVFLLEALFHVFPHVTFSRGLVAAPIIVVVLNHLFGLYGRRRLERIPVKLVLLSFSLMGTYLVLRGVDVSAEPASLWGLWMWLPLAIPRCIVGVSLSRRPNGLTSVLKANGPVLIVGGAGYIGSEVVGQLLNEGHAVRVLDKLVYGKSSLAPFLRNPRFELIDGDTTDISILTNAMYGVSGVVHLAGLVGDPACSVDENFTRHLNIISTRMVMEVAKSLGIARFVFASSCSVYGISPKILDEESEVNPVSLYARTKIDSERELLAERSHSFHPVVLRFATVFGHSYRPRFDLVANLFTAQAYHEGIIKVFGKDQWRPFIHVRDVARAVVMALHARSQDVSGQIFNVGDSRLNTTIGDLAHLVARVVSKKKSVKVDDQSSDFKDARNYAVSFEKIQKVLAFRATVTLEEGVQEILENFEKGLYPDYQSPEYSNVAVTRQIVSFFYDPEHASRLYAPVREA